jgi:aminoglycoside phosphotransferase (APT) family kinase protein
MSEFDHFLGTRPVSGQHAFDLDALNRWLMQKLPGYAGPLTVEMFKGGQSNPTYKLITPSKSYVMRAKPGPVAKLLPSAHAVEREYAVMHGLQDTDVPVPHMLCLCEDESIIGRAFYIMEFMQGRVLWDQSLPGMDKTQRRSIYNEMNRVISALHKVDFKSRGLQGYGKPGNYFERQIGRWSKQYLASITQPIAEMDQLMAWLPAHIPAMARETRRWSVSCTGTTGLTTWSFILEEPRVIAVLDWELSTLGHPLADFSYHCMAWHIPPGAFRGIGGLDLAALGIPPKTSTSASTANVPASPALNSWPLTGAFTWPTTCFAWPPSCKGIAKRVEAGTAASAQAVQAASGARTIG